eukprot:12000762-Alexandrium_andersonii.AAC.1
MQARQIDVDDSGAPGADSGLLPPVRPELRHHVHMAPLLPAPPSDAVLSVEACPGNGLHVV